jgi:POT family proton-dependent oligopeptide transporter
MAGENLSAPKERTFLGHPIGLTNLFSTEMAERFSYYGMLSFLILFLTKDLLLAGHHDDVIGYSTVKNALETVLGPLPVVRFASIILGLYTGLAYLTPVFGGYLADRVIGQRYAVVVGGVIMAAGEFMLMKNSLFFFGLLALIVGNGGFKPNISTQVGNLYRPGDSRIDRAYSIFYVGINVGATLAPLICGTLASEVGWHWGFFAAGVGVSLGVLNYLIALRTLPPDRITRARRSGEKITRAKLTPDERKAILALVVLVVPIALFWAAYQQQSIAINLWAADYTNRVIAIPGLFRYDMPAPWSQFVNPAFIFIFTPFVVAYWARLSRKNAEPTTVIKMALGCAMQAVSFLIMAGVAWLTGPLGHATWLWLILFFVVFTLAELYVSPIGLALVARIAPPQVLSLMMGFWFIAVFFGNIAGGFMGGFWDSMTKPDFFLMIAAIPAVASVIIFLFDRPLRPILEKRPATPLTPGPDLATEGAVPAE